MRLEELAELRKRGAGLLVLSKETASEKEKEAAATLMADATERIVIPHLAGQREPTQGPDARHPVRQLTLDDAFDQWRSTPWEQPELNKAFGDATGEHHKQLSAVMEAAFRAGWEARR